MVTSDDVLHCLLDFLLAQAQRIEFAGTPFEYPVEMFPTTSETIVLRSRGELVPADVLFMAYNRISRLLEE